MTIVAVDIRANHDTGVARYGRALLAAAAPIAAEQGIHLLAIVRPGQEHAAEPAVTAGHEVIAMPGDDGFIRDNPRLRNLLTARGVDLFHTTHYTVDRSCPVPFSFTIHDLTRMRFPQWSYSDSSFAQRFGAAELDRVKAELADLPAFDNTDPDASLFTRYFAALNRHLGTRAERIAAVSDSTAADVTTYLGVPPSRIDLVPCGVDTATFFPRPSGEVSAARAKHGLGGGPYLIFVGLAHPNKRFEWLVEQLAKARATFPPGSRLAAVGGHAERAAAIQALLPEVDAAEFVSFTGRVSDDELAALYTGASAWVTASVNEGNNLPPLEALACGSEVIATDIPPLRETLAQHAHFYPPTDGAALASQASAALSDQVPPLARGFTPPSWRRSAMLLVESWQRAITGSATSARPDAVTRYGAAR
ncbi:MAG: glycosyltransferase [Micromonosporaceae bacterium]